jgi:hypothetical protein
MQIKLFDGLQKVLVGFKTSTPDLEVATALTRFCKTYGNDVVVERHSHNSAQINSKRNFLIIFESNNEADQFAYEASLVTHGYEGVMVEVA